MNVLLGWRWLPGLVKWLDVRCWMSVFDSDKNRAW